MSTGKPSSDWYCAWLNALLTIHSKIDPHTPDVLHRVERLKDDIITMCYQGTGFFAYFDKADEYVAQLDSEKKIAGAIYVLTGAHLMGGEIMRRRLEGFPTKHLEWDDRKEAIAILQTYRTRDDIGEEARECFAALLSIMDEIKERYPKDV
jgi:heme oxygenase